MELVVRERTRVFERCFVFWFLINYGEEIKNREKNSGKFSSHDLITYLRDENLFLRGELAKMSDLCSRLADSKQTPVNDKVSPPVHFNQTTPLQTHVETPFVLHRRTTMPRKNTWEPTVLSTSFSALSVEDTVENSAIVIPTHDENVTTRKRSSVQMMHPNKRPQVILAKLCARGTWKQNIFASSQWQWQ